MEVFADVTARRPSRVGARRYHPNAGASPRQGTGRTRRQGSSRLEADTRFGALVVRPASGLEVAQVVWRATLLDRDAVMDGERTVTAAAVAVDAAAVTCASSKPMI